MLALKMHNEEAASLRRTGMPFIFSVVWVARRSLSVICQLADQTLQQGYSLCSRLL